MVTSEEEDMRTDGWQVRTVAVYGAETVRAFGEAKVMVVGLGGVGSYAAEMLCRIGIGRMVLVDGDCVEESNINRQLEALHSTVGQAKARLMARRLEDINPQGVFKGVVKFLGPEDVAATVAEEMPDFVVDAIDSMTTKCRLIEACLDGNVPVVSSMGAGGRRDVGRVRLADLWETRVCPLAKKVRRMLRGDGYGGAHFAVVYSDEEPRMGGCGEGERQTEDRIPKGIGLEREDEGEKGLRKRRLIGSVGFVTATFGNFLAGYVAEELSKRGKRWEDGKGARGVEG